MDDILSVMSNRWNEHAITYEEKHHGFRNDERNEWKNVLANELGEDNSKKILDVGTGTGFLSLIAAELGFSCTGIDFSKGMLAVAEKNAKERNLDIQFLQGEIDKLPFKDQSFDVVMNRSVLWTLLYPEVAMKEWLRVLKNGGSLISFYSEGKMKGNYHYPQEIEEQLPLKGAPVETVKKLFENVGFIDTVDRPLTEILSGKQYHGHQHTWYIIKGRKKS
jgi:ubiquinone/menaquinone biosynthesis C-methylase UbiE